MKLRETVRPFEKREWSSSMSNNYCTKPSKLSTVVNRFWEKFVFRFLRSQRKTFNRWFQSQTSSNEAAMKIDHDDLPISRGNTLLERKRSFFCFQPTLTDRFVSLGSNAEHSNGVASSQADSNEGNNDFSTKQKSRIDKVRISSFDKKFARKSKENFRCCSADWTRQTWLNDRSVDENRRFVERSNVRRIDSRTTSVSKKTDSQQVARQRRIIVALSCFSRIPEGEGWIIDGFPTNYDQLKILENALSGYEEEKTKEFDPLLAPNPRPPPPPEPFKSIIDLVILFHVTNDTVIRRAAGRTCKTKENDENRKFDFCFSSIKLLLWPIENITNSSIQLRSVLLPVSTVRNKFSRRKTLPTTWNNCNIE